LAERGLSVDHGCAAGADGYEKARRGPRSVTVLRNGGMLGVLIDQHAGDKGVWTPFFGRLASTTPFPVRYYRPFARADLLGGSHSLADSGGYRVSIN
jgi:lauroyl/myristoyl acyltransferase